MRLPPGSTAIAAFGCLLSAAAIIAAAGCGSSDNGSGGLPGSQATLDQVTRGHYLVTSLACSECHNRGVDDPSDPNWLAGFIPNPADQGSFQIGPFKTYAANITPDPTHGLGGVSDQRVFNALRYGLDPMDPSSPDAVITSAVPGQGGFPANPHYLAPPMPWPEYRHLSDADTWSIVAYLKHGVKANANAVPSSQAPGDNWMSNYQTSATSAADKVGPVTMPPYPAASEQFSP